MDIFCFLCNQHFKDCSKLFCHLKHLHQLSSISVYTCCFLSCTQKFSCFKSFSKHMRNEYANKLKDNVNEDIYEIHKESPQSSEVPKQNDIPDLSNKSLSSNNNLATLNTNSRILTNTNVNTKELSDKSFKLSLKNYANKNFSRSEATKMQKNIQKNIAHPIKNELKKIISQLNPHNLKHARSSIYQLVNFCNEPFKNFDTEYKFIKKLKNDGLYQSPQIITLNNTISNVVVNRINTLDEVQMKGILFPIKFNMKKFFEIEGIYEEFENSLKKVSESTSLNNFYNGKLWQTRIKESGDKVVIPYFLYFDDFEVNTNVGPHSSALLGVYFSFPTAPEFLKFKLHNVFIAALFKAKDVKTFGNDVCFYRLIEVLNDLDTSGIEIVTKHGKKKIFLSLALIVGDNLALNSVLGFSRSFSANHFCRICKTDKELSKTLFEEETDKLRTFENYMDDVNLDDTYSTGIRENSIFNNINNYHVTQNIYADILHDMLEGVLNYDFCHIILLFFKNKSFDLELLNIRKVNFDYGEIESGNKSPEIEMHHLKNFKLKMSAREMLTFAHFFPLLIGDLVDVDSDLWAFVINLIELLDLMLLSNFTSLDIINLKSHIELHNKKYVELFSDSLKPKHHFLCHYPRIVEHSGPFIFLWTFSFESKHRELKSYTKNITSRKNLPLSLAIKFGISFSEQITNFEIKHFELGSIKYSIEKSPFFNELKTLINTENVNKCVCYFKFDRYQTTYKKGFIIFFYDPTFSAFQIQEIILVDGKVYFFCQKVNVISYEKNFLSYIIGEKLLDFEIFPETSIKSPPIQKVMLKGKLFLRPKSLF